MNLKPLILTIVTAFFAMSATAVSGQINSVASLRSDLRMAKASAHVRIIDVGSDVASPNFKDCGQRKAVGYCSYRITAEVKEVFKGRITGDKMVYFITVDADFDRDKLFGERIVFLVRGKARRFEAIENSTRPIENDVVKKMRSLKRKRKS